MSPTLTDASPLVSDPADSLNVMESRRSLLVAAESPNLLLQLVGLVLQLP